VWGGDAIKSSLRRNGGRSSLLVKRLRQGESASNLVTSMKQKREGEDWSGLVRGRKQACDFRKEKAPLRDSRREGEHDFSLGKNEKKRTVSRRRRTSGQSPLGKEKERVPTAVSRRKERWGSLSPHRGKNRDQGSGAASSTKKGKKIEPLLGGRGGCAVTREVVPSTKLKKRKEGIVV